jgi:cation-transporting P-type ATPase E
MMSHSPRRSTDKDDLAAGLSDEVAAARRAAGQGNLAKLPSSTSFARILRRNVLTILNATLFSVSVLLLLLGRYLDAAFTAVPVGGNVLMAVFLEVKAKRQLDRLTLIHTPRVTVRRSGAEREVVPSQLVLGDVVSLRRGDQAVVDGRVIDGTVEMDESVITGESVPVLRVPGDTIRSGSVVVAGSAAVETTHVGEATYASGLAARARRGRDERTPLRRDLDTLILFIGAITLLVSLLVAISFALAGDSLLSTQGVRAAAVLVALVPQGLAIMATVTYSIAAVRVSRTGAVVQRIDAAEAMSRVDTLCADKTGTLTAPRLSLDRLVPLGSELDVDDLRRRIGGAAASMPATDRTMAALAAAFPQPAGRARSQVPFSSMRRWSGIALERDAKGIAFASPELFATSLESGKEPMGEVVREMAQEGSRVLLVLDISAEELEAAGDGPPVGHIVAAVGLREEIREDAASTLDALRQREVMLKLISGDDPRTVAAIGRRVGLPAESWLTGSDIEGLDDESLAEASEQVDIFGRVQPDDKPRVVQALRSRGHRVAMVGDGVNDVLALRRADLGVAMESGSPAARSVAGIVLLRDRFAVLPNAITEGQRVVSAMIAVACLLLARTVYMLILVALAALLRLPFPFTPTSNAVLAMVTVGIPIFLLALWVPPVRAPESVVRRTLSYAVPLGLAVSVLVVPLMIHAFATYDVATARSLVTAATVFAGIALIPIIFPAVPDRASPVGPGGDLRPAVMAGAMLLLYAAILVVPPVREIYDLVPLPAEVLGGLLAATLVWAAAIIIAIRLGLPQKVAALWASVTQR